MVDNGTLAYTVTELPQCPSLCYAPKERNVHILVFLLSGESVSDLRRVYTRGLQFDRR